MPSENVQHDAPIQVYVGVITSKSAAEGDCADLTFGFFGHSIWNFENVVSMQNLKCANLPTCDVKVTAPDENTPAELWIIKTSDEQEVAKLYLKEVKIPFKDCG